MPDFNDLEFEIEDGTSVITISRPQERNRLTRQTMVELAAALKISEAEPNIRAVIITGKGEYFCAGGQLDSFPNGFVMGQRSYAEAFIDIHRGIYQMSKPVIAAVQGHAIAGGMTLVEACDLAVAGKNCRFGLPELVAGLFPMLALAVMQKGLSKKRAFELIYTGKSIDAETARDWNLINTVVEQEKVLETGKEWAEEVGKLSRVAMSFGREAYYKMLNMNWDSALEYAKNARLGLLCTEDAMETTRALQENRKPKWQGR
jgi:enoyl-CoA hydratase/carnithine racemase